MITLNKKEQKALETAASVGGRKAELMDILKSAEGWMSYSDLAGAMDITVKNFCSVKLSLKRELEGSKEFKMFERKTRVGKELGLMAL